MKRLFMLLFVCGCVLVGTAHVAHADFVVPEEWTGIWQTVTTQYSCGDHVQQGDPIAATDTLCADTVIPDPQNQEVPLSCTSSADATSFSTHCEGSGEIFAGCTASIVYDLAGTRTGDSYHSVATISITYSGSCFGTPDYCLETDADGTRIAPAPIPCGNTPVESQNWGSVKSLYR